MKNFAMRQLWLGLWLVLPTVASAQAQEQTWKINVKGMPLNQFIEQVSRITGKTILLDRRLSGQVSIFSDQQLDANSVYRVFLSVIRNHDAVATETDGVVSVVQSTSGRLYSGSGESSPDADSMLTHVVHLDYIKAAEIIQGLRKLVPSYGLFTAIDDINAVVITDYRENITNVVKLIADIDRPNDTRLEVFPLEHVWVDNVVAMLTSIIESDELGLRSAIQLIANPHNNSLAIYGTPEQISGVRGMISEIDQPTVVKGLTRVFNLRFAEAENVATIVNQLILGSSGAVTRSTPTRGSEIGNRQQTVVHDESLNAVVVRAEPSLMAEIEALIDQLDVKRLQVLIEAAVVEVSVVDSAALGVELGVADDSGDRLPVATTTVNGVLTSLLQSLSIAEDEDSDPQASDALGALTQPSIAIAELDPSGLSFGVILNALATITETNLLSTPYVTAVDNAESKVIVGESVPLRSSSLFFEGQNNAFFPTTRTERRDIGIELVVKPHIHENGTVMLEVQQSVENVINPELGIGDTGFADIVTEKREVETTVIADSGQTIVLGGLISDQVQNETKSVPGLGRIPLLGRLFRSDSTTVRKRHLLVFLRPTILDDKDSVAATTTRKFNRIWQTTIRPGGVQEVPPIESLYDGEVWQREKE